MLEATNAMFQLVLADYTPEQVREAFAVYLKRNNEMPAPSDIATIIDRGGKPPLDRSVYVSIAKKDGADRTADDWAYLRDYEKFAKHGY